MYGHNIFSAAALFASLGFSWAAPADSSHQFRLQSYRPTEYWVPGRLAKAANVFNLKHHSGKSRSAQFVDPLRRGGQVNGVYGFEQLNTTLGGNVFTTEMEIGSKTFTVVLDTGSSDTWVAGKGFACLSTEESGVTIPESGCRFGPLYTTSSTFQTIPNENFHIAYSDGESLDGTFGTEHVTVAGIEVKNQQIAIVNQAAWNGDSVSSGLLGLAFPADTHAFTGSNSNADSASNQKLYNPLFTNMYTEGQVAPLFSLALDRTGGGYLAIGGLPPVDYIPIFSSSPFQILSLAPEAGTTGSTASSASQYTLYTITVAGFKYNNAKPAQWTYATWPNPFGTPSDSTQVQMIVDSGQTNSYLPPKTAAAVNKLFSPAPLRTDPDSGYTYISCTAKAPEFGVTVGYETFFIDARDMVVKLDGGECISAVASAGEGGTSVLGHPFLKNVVAVFDVGASQMHFAARNLCVGCRG